MPEFCGPALGNKRGLPSLYYQRRRLPTAKAPVSALMPMLTQPRLAAAAREERTRQPYPCSNTALRAGGP